ncbi:D-glycero-beta-D-manno-heptose-7-phosphate kinase [Thermodesulfobacterium sp. TA1]|uniref:D-glycero-beta-D-manno-heptose-7-phosphate kinase n=1 Tax=Thermodesulfobacterium sp. TA1 TaxID=2234087 RepID=UPI001232A8B3|nr:D-glycero-beta-D-manno-heptose-7-phosphate kinase [Thermodesulfobacterium sp. TA1]QER41213.1 D-glycero-beta-D-manno-heptose-7-phosphate kinase [Thermodesulfobacterium sp. TA1]
MTLKFNETFLNDLEKRLANTKIMVIGDLILDCYFSGEVNRISPEAPVPVFDLRSISYSLGGAANVAANLRGLKAQVELIGIVGKDDKGEILKDLAKKQGIGTQGIVEDQERPTTLKTRIIAQSQHLLRVDFEKKDPLNVQLIESLKKIYQRLLPEVDAVILSDYAKGVLMVEEFCRELIEEARKAGKPVLVDPKSVSWRKYQGATSITPNLKEFKQTALKEDLPIEDLEESGKALIEKFGLDFLVITLGKDGVFLVQPEKRGLHLPAQAKEVYDVSGAGDTMISSLTAFYTAGLPLEKALEMANIAAGIVVGKVGTKPVYWEEIKAFFYKNNQEGYDG